MWTTVALIALLGLVVGGSIWLAVGKAESAADAKAKVAVVEKGQEVERDAEKALDAPRATGGALVGRLRRRNRPR